jgi:hypothetical protein
LNKNNIENESFLLFFEAIKGFVEKSFFSSTNNSKKNNIIENEN